MWRQEPWGTTTGSTYFLRQVPVWTTLQRQDSLKDCFSRDTLTLSLVLSGDCTLQSTTRHTWRNKKGLILNYKVECFILVQIYPNFICLVSQMQQELHMINTLQTTFVQI